MIQKKRVPDDPERFKGDKELHQAEEPSRVRMSGYYELDGGYTVAYALTKQKPSARYLVRGTVALLNPADGRVLKAKRRKGEAAGASGQAKEVRCAVNVDSEEGAVLRRKVAEAATRLLGDHVLLLADAAEKSVAVSDMRFSLAVAIFSDRYLCAKSRSADARHVRHLRLKKLAAQMQEELICQISQRTVKRACSAIGGNWREYVQEASSFLTFVYSLKRDSDSHNPFSTYLEAHPTPHQRDTLKLQKTVANGDTLSAEEERALNRELLAHPENGMYVGVSLIKDSGLATKPACALLWQDVLFMDKDEDTVLVRYQRDEVAGATHCYNFPIVGVGARVLRQRRDWLLAQGLSPEQIARLTVVSHEERPQKSLDPSVLTAACRHLVRFAGVGYATLAGLRELETGGGVKLLHKTYEKRVAESCGLGNDTELCAFLSHKSLATSVQASYYRSFTDESALHMMQFALRRDHRFEKEKRPKNPIKTKKVGEREQVTVFAPSSHHRSQVTVRVRLKPGEEVRILSQYGCTVAVDARAV